MKLDAATATEVAKTVKELVGDLQERWLETQKADVNSAMLTALKNLSPKDADVKKPGKGIMASRFMRAVAGGRTKELAEAFAVNHLKDPYIAKALSASESTAGGVLVPTEFSTDIIELLQETAVFRSMQPVIYPMPTGSVTIPKLTGGASANYIGESQDIPESEQTFGQIAMSWKKLAALVPMSNDLLRFEAVGADAIVRDDTVNAISWREDNAFLRGDGSEFTPKGVRHYALAANVVAMTATPDLAKITADLANAILRLRNGNVRMIRPSWLFAPRTEMGLMTLRDGNGNLVFAEEMTRGTLFGIPYKSSTVVPINLGGTDSEVYLMDMADIIIGEANTIEVSASDIAPYMSGGSMKSAFSLDQTVLKVLTHHDLGVRHEESITVITGVTWAPGAP